MRLSASTVYHLELLMFPHKVKPSYNIVVGRGSQHRCW